MSKLQESNGSFYVTLPKKLVQKAKKKKGDDIPIFETDQGLLVVLDTKKIFKPSSQSII